MLNPNQFSMVITYAKNLESTIKILNPLKGACKEDVFPRKAHNAIRKSTWHLHASSGRICREIDALEGSYSEYNLITTSWLRLRKIIWLTRRGFCRDSYWKERFMHTCAPLWCDDDDHLSICKNVSSEQSLKYLSNYPQKFEIGSQRRRASPLCMHCVLYSREP